ncbi:MAG: hypothetical protein HZA95_00665 [Candidatus Vogelbacteria bacterium]|nr:hypothetical protein [Candidatus Vogelbacteria bacterium]
MMKRLAIATAVALVLGCLMALAIRPADSAHYLRQSADAEVAELLGEGWTLDRVAAIEAEGAERARENERETRFPHLVLSLREYPKLESVARTFSATALESAAASCGTSSLLVVESVLDPANPLPVMRMKQLAKGLAEKGITGVKRFVADPQDSFNRFGRWVDRKVEGGLSGIGQSLESTVSKMSTEGVEAGLGTTPLTRVEAAEQILASILNEGWSFLGTHYTVGLDGKVQPLPGAIVINFMTSGLTNAERKFTRGESLTSGDVANAALDVVAIGGLWKAAKAAGAANAARRSAILAAPLKGAVKGGKLASVGSKVAAFGKAGLRSRLAKGAVAGAIAYGLYRNPQWVTAAAGFIARQMGWSELAVQMALWFVILGIPLFLLAGLWGPLALIAFKLAQFVVRRMQNSAPPKVLHPAGSSS